MKNQKDPTTFADLELILERASQISNHRRFVIAGSLSALGAMVIPPKAMVLSRDLDMYPQLDPERGFLEISKQIGEGSAFHKEHGVYADPITPKLLSLPDGWESRMVPISTKSGAVALFLDLNDVAIGKLARGHENDLRWVEAGLDERILSLETIATREKTVFNLSLEERLKIQATLCAMRLSRKADCPDSVPEDNHCEDLNRPRPC